jgi:hypothetical protein
MRRVQPAGRIGKAKQVIVAPQGTVEAFGCTNITEVRGSGTVQATAGLLGAVALRYLRHWRAEVCSVVHLEDMDLSLVTRPFRYVHQLQLMCQCMDYAALARR